MTRWRGIVVGCAAASLAAIVAAGMPWAQSWIWPRHPGAFSGRADGLPWGPGMAPPVVEGVAGMFIALLAQYLLGVVVLFLIPGRVRAMAGTLRTGGRRLARVFLIGLSAVVLIAAIGLLAVLSVQMFPLPFLLLGLLFMAALGGVVAIEFELGRELLARAGWYGDRPLLALALGTLLAFALANLPLVGWPALGGLWLTGAGAAVASRFGSGRTWSLHALVEDGQA